MKGVTKALISMNKGMDLGGLQKVMTDFMRENEKSEITQEALAEALDDAMEEEGSSEQEESIVNQVLLLIDGSPSPHPSSVIMVAEKWTQ